MRRYRRKSDGLFLFTKMTKEEKELTLKAIEWLKTALEQCNQSKMYEMMLFHKSTMDYIITEFGRKLFEISEDARLANHIFEQIKIHNQLHRSPDIIALGKGVFEILIQGLANFYNDSND